MSEHDLQNRILRVANTGNVRLWRINSGVAWQGKEQWIIDQGRRVLILSEPRRVQLAEKGTPDLYGFIQRDGVAVHVEIEVKNERGRVSKEQAARIELVKKMGGVAFVARSVYDLENLV